MDVPLFLKQTTEWRHDKQGKAAAEGLEGEREVVGSPGGLSPQQAFLGTRVTYSLPRECPLGPRPTMAQCG